MYSLQKNSNLHGFNNKGQNDIVDITVRLSRLETSAILKAAALKPVVREVTIGPDCSQEVLSGCENESSTQNEGCVFTSTPNNSRRTGNVLNGETQLNHECSLSAIESSHSDRFGFNIEGSKVNKSILPSRTPDSEASEKRLSGVQTALRMKYLEHKNKANKIDEGVEVKRNVLLNERQTRGQKNEEAVSLKKQLNEEEIKLKMCGSKFFQSNELHVKKMNETAEKLKEMGRQQQQEQQRLIDEKEKQRSQQQELSLNCEQLYQLQVEYRNKYQQLHDIIKKCNSNNEFLAAVSSEVPKLKTIREQFNLIVEKCTNGYVNKADVNSASNLLSQLSDLLQIIFKHSDIINKQVQKVEKDEKKVVKEKEIIQMEAEDKSEVIETPLQSGVSDCVDRISLAKHLKLNKFLEDYEQSLEVLVNDDRMKKFRFDCQKAVNVPVNAISPLNGMHLEDKFHRLSRLLQGQTVSAGNGQISASSHELGVKFCTNLLAKKFVRQGEHTVSSKPEAAFAIAAVIVALWINFPDFGKLLLAHFQRTCPYLIPAFMPQVEGQSNEDYYRMLGYLYLDDGKVEPQDKFLKRMSGVMRLYAAILITPLRRVHLSLSKTHPIGLQESWRWLAASLNLEPRPDISATLMFDFLEITGSAMYQNYGRQFRKILLLLCKEYFPRIEKVTPEGCGGPVCRLKAFLERILKEGRIPPPDGALPYNFW